MYGLDNKSKDTIRGISRLANGHHVLGPAIAIFNTTLYKNFAKWLKIAMFNSLKDGDVKEWKIDLKNNNLRTITERFSYSELSGDTLWS